MQKYYCNQKFWWLSVNLQRAESLSCAAAMPHRIDIKQLKHSGTDIFNTEILQQERQQMLNGQQVQSCVNTCWNPEAAGLSSRRNIMRGDLVTHTNIISTPEIVHVILGNQCNMTCSYCCKQYSSAWYQDIKQNGKYNVESQHDRFNINIKDKVVAGIGQKQISGRSETQFLIEQLKNLIKGKNLRELQITGGEPFLYVGLDHIVEKLQSVNKINIYSGLGVNQTLFEKQLKKLKKYKNYFTITISAEGTEDFYEFNRAGNSWKRFKENIQCIENHKIEYKFNSIVSNLTVFGLPQFEEFAKGKIIKYQPCSDPDFLSVHVLDQQSKKNLMEKILQTDSIAKKIVAQSIDKNPTETQHKNFSSYVKEFAKRRNKNLSIFPKTMLDWLSSKNFSTVTN